MQRCKKSEFLYGLGLSKCDLAFLIVPTNWVENIKNHHFLARECKKLLCKYASTSNFALLLKCQQQFFLEAYCKPLLPMKVASLKLWKKILWLPIHKHQYAGRKLLVCFYCPLGSEWLKQLTYLVPLHWVQRTQKSWWSNLGCGRN